MQKKILRYRYEQDRRLSLIGKMLLRSQLEYYGLLQQLPFTSLIRNEYGRPSFGHPFDFNISHSEKLVICAAGMGCSIGADIEYVKETEIEDFRQQFNVFEWELITQDTDPVMKFFEFWTRKESVAKAVGTGINILRDIDVTGETAVYNDTIYRHELVPIDEQYKACVAFSGCEKHIRLKRICLD